jgi:tetratricopeptide (TPR) repeat protein
LEKLDGEVQEASAIDSLKSEVERNPTDVKKYLSLGWAYYGGDQLDEAIETFRNAKHHFPEDIEVLYGLALAYKKAGYGEEALDIFRKVIESTKSLQDQTRGAMLRRMAIGHVHVIERGDWDLRNETWERR